MNGGVILNMAPKKIEGGGVQIIHIKHPKNPLVSTHLRHRPS